MRTTSRPGVSFQDTQHPRYEADHSKHPDNKSSSSLGASAPIPPKFTSHPSSSGFSTSSHGYDQEPQLSYGPTEGYGQAYQPAPGGVSGMLGIGQPGGLGGGANDVRRKKSLVRPDRERIDPNHRLYHYRERVAQENQGGGGMNVLPSTTGNAPPGLRRGKSLLGREPTEAQESGLTIFKRGTTLRRKGRNKKNESAGDTTGRPAAAAKQEKHGCLGDFAPGPKNAWMVYCYLLTICVPGFVLRGVFSMYKSARAIG